MVPITTISKYGQRPRRDGRKAGKTAKCMSAHKDSSRQASRAIMLQYVVPWLRMKATLTLEGVKMDFTLGYTA